MVVDVTNESSVAEAAAVISSDLSSRAHKLIALVNNAGIAHILPVELIDISEMKKVYDVNVFGVLTMMKHFLPMLRRNQGRVVVISSISGFFSTPLYGAYSSSKSAVEALCDAARAELDHFNVSVSLIQAGTIKDTAIREKNSGANAAKLKLTDSDRKLYSHFLEGTDGAVAKIEASADPPSVVATCVLHSITSAFPRARYYNCGGANGIPAWVLKAMVTVLPDRLLDKFKLSKFRSRIEDKEKKKK